MLNKTVRSIIIVTIQLIVPVTLLLIIAPQIIGHSHQFDHLGAFLNNHQLQFLIAHCCFYLALFLIWPYLIKLVISRQSNEPNPASIKTATFARWYLIGAMAFFEFLTWWK
jgi:hypothetical protein